MINNDDNDDVGHPSYAFTPKQAMKRREENYAKQKNSHIKSLIQLINGRVSDWPNDSAEGRPHWRIHKDELRLDGNIEIWNLAIDEVIDVFKAKGWDIYRESGHIFIRDRTI